MVSPEFRWLHLFVLNGHYEYLDGRGAVPVFDPEYPDPLMPPCVKVTLNREGDGALAPFEGVRHLPRYNLVDWYAWIADENNDPEADDPGEDCADAVLRIAAEPDAQWIFKRWELRTGSLREIMLANGIILDAPWRLHLPALVLPLTQDTALALLFACRAEQAGLDLVQHLGEFLVEIGALPQAQDVLDLSWDLGGLENRGQSPIYA